MNRTIKRLILILTILVPAAGILWAHHGSHISYDMTRQVTVRGVIKHFSFQNPHIYFTFDVKDDRGNVTEWAAETEPPRLMESRYHWNPNYLQPGDQVTVTVWPIKSGISRGLLVRLVTADGRVTNYIDTQGD